HGQILTAVVIEQGPGRLPLLSESRGWNGEPWNAGGVRLGRNRDTGELLVLDVVVRVPQVERVGIVDRHADLVRVVLHVRVRKDDVPPPEGADLFLFQLVEPSRRCGALEIGASE